MVTHFQLQKLCFKFGFNSGSILMSWAGEHHFCKAFALFKVQWLISTGSCALDGTPSRVSKFDFFQQFCVQECSADTNLHKHRGKIEPLHTLFLNRIGSWPFCWLIFSENRHLTSFLMVMKKKNPSQPVC